MCYSDAFLGIVCPNSALFYCISGKVLLPETTLNFIQRVRELHVARTGERRGVYRGLLGKETTFKTQA
jgi:hypothetical protein